MYKQFTTVLMTLLVYFSTSSLANAQNQIRHDDALNEWDLSSLFKDQFGDTAVVLLSTDGIFHLCRINTRDNTSRPLWSGCKSGPSIDAIGQAVIQRELYKDESKKLTDSVANLRTQIRQTYETRIVEMQGLILKEINNVQKDLNTISDEDYDTLRKRLVADMKKYFAEKPE